MSSKCELIGSYSHAACHIVATQHKLLHNKQALAGLSESGRDSSTHASPTPRELLPNGNDDSPYDSLYDSPYSKHRFRPARLQASYWLEGQYCRRTLARCPVCC